MTETSDFQNARMRLNNGTGHIPALGFGTLIPDPALTIAATRDALEAGISPTSIARNDTVTSVKWARPCSQDLPLERSHEKTSLLPPRCGTPITDPSASNPLSSRASQDSSSAISTSISFTRHLRFNQATSRIRAIKTAMSFTTTESPCSKPGGRWKVS